MEVPPQNVRLYLGTPTCFAIKTTRQMLINPYPYISVSFDSPCLHVEYSITSGVDRPGYFFDEFNSRTSVIGHRSRRAHYGLRGGH